MEPHDVTYFQSPEAFREWLAENHATADVLWVGFWKKGTGRPSITWPESVEQALCFGWIDGIRKSLGDDAYTIRFTPRREGSHWSRKNVTTYAALEAAGLIQAAGRAAWEIRDPDNSARASYEREEEAQLPPELRALLDANDAASAWFDAQPPGYRRITIHWVTSAKRPETRERRMRRLVEDSAAGRRIKELRRAGE